jgi:hypothetical protein
MPATSRAQQQAMAIAEHSPDKLNSSNKSMLNMSKQQLGDFAGTPTTGLPRRKMYGYDGATPADGAGWPQSAPKKPAAQPPMNFSRKHYGAPVQK